MKVVPYLFSFKGRIGRGDFWLLMLTIVAILSVGMMVNGLLGIGAATAILGPAAFIGIVVIGLSAMARRLHDRNKSAWYILLFLGLPTALQAFHSGRGGDTVRVMIFSGGFNSFIDIVCLAISLWMIVELGLLAGTAGDNDYGAAPLPGETASG